MTKFIFSILKIKSSLENTRGSIYVKLLFCSVTFKVAISIVWIFRSSLSEDLESSFYNAFKFETHELQLGPLLWLKFYVLLLFFQGFYIPPFFHDENETITK